VFFWAASAAFNFENVTLVVRWKKHLQWCLAIFLVAELPPKEVF